ncbi:hypothetical protein OSB04_003954, partial [Centaurea solstitialis]
MQPTGGAGAGGLSRFRSVPATWLETLLETEEEEQDVIIDPPKPIIGGSYLDPNLLLPPTPAAGIGRRQSSSPAEFLSEINNLHGHGYLSNFDDYLSSSFHGEAKPSTDPKFTTQLSGDQSALLDVEMDKLLEDSVPCRVRAKRGCATHPRSIAERVRRTRISDRIRKLQELVPNMDKVNPSDSFPLLSFNFIGFYGLRGLMCNGLTMQQTNTADMLEEAVDYVKFLQQQIQ